jgi:Cu2+-exporting ATPase
MPASFALDPADCAADAADDAAAATRARSNWRLLDEPDQWPFFSRPLGHAGGRPGERPAQRWESQFLIEGMHCAACAFNVEAALAKLPGVERVDVDGASRRARIRWSDAASRPSQWLEAAARAGYGLVPAGDLPARARRLREGRLALWRWLVAGLCMMQVMMYAYPAYTARPGELAADSAQLLRWASWVLSLPVLVFSCGPFFRGALRDLRHGRIGMDLPVALGIAISFAVSSVATFDPAGPLGQEVYFDSLTMFVFFLLSGRWLESRLRERTAGALEGLLNRLPDSVLRRVPDGPRFQRVPVERVRPGDVLRVLPGERFAVDGVLVEGDTAVDESLLSGESHPQARACGEQVLAGSHNLSAPVCMRVESVGQDTRFAGIVALMDSAALSKPRLARLADRMARPFLLVVLAAATLAAAWWWPASHGQALMVAVAVLIVTCPCALSLATPAAMLASAGALARRGLLVRELQPLEALAGVDTVVFDKTGTLTRDTPRLTRIYCRQGMRPREALERAAVISAASLHPVARALVAAWRAAPQSTLGEWTLLQATEHGGLGLDARLARGAAVHGAPCCHMRLGTAAFCEVPALDLEAMQVHLADEAGWFASFVLTEDLRADAIDTVAALRERGLELHLLSGDRVGAVRALAARVGIGHVQGGCTPEDKLRYLRDLQAQGRRVLMVGDGLNDGPVLARADASMAFGAQAAPLTQARADFIALGGELRVIEKAWLQARATMRVVRQNLAWAAAYNLLCIPLALVGWLPAWLAGLGMAASSLVVVANAARLSAARKAAS